MFLFVLLTYLTLKSFYKYSNATFKYNLIANLEKNIVIIMARSFFHFPFSDVTRHTYI